MSDSISSEPFRKLQEGQISGEEYASLVRADVQRYLRAIVENGSCPVCGGPMADASLSMAQGGPPEFHSTCEEGHRYSSP